MVETRWLGVLLLVLAGCAPSSDLVVLRDGTEMCSAGPAEQLWGTTRFTDMATGHEVIARETAVVIRHGCEEGWWR